VEGKATNTENESESVNFNMFFVIVTLMTKFSYNCCA